MAGSLRLARPPKSQRTAVAPRRLLSLSGGGYRGLFTAQVLERMEAQARRPLRECFDILGGTSVGGILAIGLAAGIPAGKLREELEIRGRKIFRARKRSAGGFLSARYDPGPLGEAIDAILGPTTSATFADLPVRVLAVAIHEETAAPKIFRSEALAPGEGDLTSVRDVALATSAAPTYFPPHVTDGETYVDGGLIANTPDLVLATEAIRRFAVNLDALTLCAIGTAGSPRTASATGAPGKIGWIARHGLVDLTIDAQARLAAEQIDRLAPNGIVRIDAQPDQPIAMDDARKAAARILMDLGDRAFEQAVANHGARLRSLLAPLDRS